MEKYFTPGLEDIRIGYELEEYKPIWDDDYIVDSGIWVKTSVQSGRHLDYLTDKIDLKQVRVPYLTKEQIEAEGWEFDEKNSTEYNWWFNKEGCTFLYWLKGSNHCEMDREEEYDIGYRGECKDINTFRYIQKLLKIKL